MKRRTKFIVAGVVALLTSPLWVNGLAALGELVAYGSLYEQGRPSAIFAPGLGMSTLIPNSSATGLVHSVTVNSHGLRGPEPLAEKPDNGLRIWTLGGSSTYDVFARRDATTWPAQLGEQLQASHPELVVEVLNGGRPGEVLAGSVEQLEELDEALQPDIAVVMHGPNDLRGVLSFQEHGAPGQPVVCDQDVLPPMDLAVLRWKERLEGTKPIAGQAGFEGRALGADGRRQLRRQLELNATRLAERGLAVVFVSHPLRAPSLGDGTLDAAVLQDYTFHLSLDADAIVEAYGIWNDEVRDAARRVGGTYVDLAAEFPHDEVYWGDVSHFSDEGSALAAERIAAAIDEADLARTDVRGPNRAKDRPVHRPPAPSPPR